MALSGIDAQVVNAAFTKTDEVIRYLGIELVTAFGIDNSTMIAASVDNLFLGTDLVSDYSEIELGNFPKPNEDKIFIKGRMRVGVNIAYPSECVLYTA